MNPGDTLLLDSAFDLAGASAGTLALALLALALIDSTSIGTLVVPVWLLLSPGRVRLARILVYLGTITVFYFVVGTALALGAHVLLERVQDTFDVDGETVLRLVVGVAMLAGCVFIVAQNRRGRRSRPHADGAGDAEATTPGRLARWRSRAMGVADDHEDTAPDDGTGDGTGGAPDDGTHDATHGGTHVSGPASRPRPGATRTRKGRPRKGSSIWPLVAMALTAGVLEVATMLPYLGAIGLVTAEGPGWPLNGVVLAGYCVVMVLPALLLTIVRVLAHVKIEGLLRRIERWFTRNTTDMAWLLGILGAVLSVGALQDLGWL
ncbi:GAP family protein [Phytoactinopolyspora halotolerans]|uniref:GAP family protein n=1 Tax=Phytoactinopolyspora halotolerans TaxID=1981512 RepID=A0A6L9SFB7_9ACTN|nr:GAP family protein [Phytoactinopolyspora halotolerans]NEE03344.1 hypothetical protein [Phytoactinopolyspora halotolerans]